VITGVVSVDREAVMQLEIIDGLGARSALSAVVDTGYTGWLTLPPDLIAKLGLMWIGKGHGALADGTSFVTYRYNATIIWDGQPISIQVDSLDSDVLVGMSLMYGYEFLMPIVDGSTFTLRNLVGY